MRSSAIAMVGGALAVTVGLYVCSRPPESPAPPAQAHPETVRREIANEGPREEPAAELYRLALASASPEAIRSAADRLDALELFDAAENLDELAAALDALPAEDWLEYAQREADATGQAASLTRNGVTITIYPTENNG